MGKYKNGINGPFSGKVGSVVGSSWHEVDYMRGMPNVPRTKKSTEPQIDQQSVLSVASHFMSSMKNAIQFGFNVGKTGQSFYSSASSYLMKNAIDKTTSPFSIIYSEVLVTKGEYPGAKNASAVAGGAGEIVFSWKDNTGIGVAKAKDKVVLFIYSSRQNAFYFKYGLAYRSDETVSLNVDVFKGETVQTYISFMERGETEVSSSVFAGEIVIAAKHLSKKVDRKSNRM